MLFDDFDFIENTCLFEDCSNRAFEGKPFCLSHCCVTDGCNELAVGNPPGEHSLHKHICHLHLSELYPDDYDSETDFVSTYYFMAGEKKRKNLEDADNLYIAPLEKKRCQFVSQCGVRCRQYTNEKQMNRLKKYCPEHYLLDG